MNRVRRSALLIVPLGCVATALAAQEIDTIRVGNVALRGSRLRVEGDTFGNG